MSGAGVLEGILQLPRQAGIHAEQDARQQRGFRVGEHAVDVLEGPVLDGEGCPQKWVAAPAWQDGHKGVGHVGVDMAGSEIIAVGEIFVLGRRAHLAAQAQDLAVVIGLVVGDAHQDQALCRQVAVARIHAGDLDAQVGVVVPVVWRLDDRAGDQQVVIAVIIEGNVERIEPGNGHLVTCRAQEQAGYENQNKRGK